MKKLIYPAAVIASTLLFLPACQQLQQLSDMQASTAQMNSTTAALNDKTSTVQTVLGYMEDLGRQGESLKLRNENFKNLMTDHKIDQKLLDADLFMNAFEFQLWEENSISNANFKVERDLLARDSVNEFFNRLQTVDHWDAKSIDPFAGGGPHFLGFDVNGTDNQKAVFNMMAATIHAVNRIDDTSAKDSQLETLSMFSLIRDGLLASKSIRDGNSLEGDYPAYVMMVRRNEPLAIRLLKARYSELGLVLVGRIVDISGDLGKAFQLKILGDSWDFDMSKMNSAQLEYYKLHLDYAKATKDVLTQIGETVELNPDVRKLYSHMHVISQPKEKIKDANLEGDQHAMLAAFQEYLK